MASTLLALLLHLAQFTLNRGQSSVAVQNETATAQYYRASADTTGATGFALGTITCAADKDCYIWCDFNSGCTFTKIHAQNARNLYVECIATSACTDIEVKGPTSSTSHSSILCDGNTACSGSNTLFAVNTSSSVNIHCTGSTGTSIGSCSSIQIYSPHNLDTVNITCGAYDCNNIKIWTAPSAYHTMLTCEGSTSCTNALITCIHGNGKSTLSYSTQWDCSDPACCPLLQNTAITASTEIDCSATSCSGTYIDGQSADLANMTVLCTNANECQYSKIMCPADAYCRVECRGAASCQDAVIDASQSSSLHIICGASGCQRADIYCPAETESCRVECLGQAYACNAVQIYQLQSTANQYLAITCPPASFTDACTDIRFECPSAINQEIYLDYPDTCTVPLSACCPYQTLTPTDSPTSISTTTPAPNSNTTPLPTTATVDEEPVDGGDSGDSGNALLLYIVIGGFAVMAVCICIFGSICLMQRHSADGGRRGSGTRTEYSSRTSRNGGENSSMKKTKLRANPSGTSPQIQLEKSVEITQQTITDAPETSHLSQQTATSYNPSKNGPPRGPPSIGLADLGNSGW